MLENKLDMELTKADLRSVTRNHPGMPRVGFSSVTFRFCQSEISTSAKCGICEGKL